MKVYVSHDSAGNIVGLVVPAEGVKPGDFAAVAEPGQFVAEIDVPDENQSPRDQLVADLAQNYRVEHSGAAARFVRKREPPDR